MSDQTIATVLTGLDGSTPLGFLAALGTLRAVASTDGPLPTLSWTHSGTWRPVLNCRHSTEELARALDADRASLLGSALLRDENGYRYPKVEKNRTKLVKGLRPPVGVLRGFMREWLCQNEMETIRYAAATLVETATERLTEDRELTAADLDEWTIPYDSRSSLADVIAPIPLDFTARNEQFLQQVKVIGEGLQEASFTAELFEGAVYTEAPLPELRWSQDAEAPGALYSAGRRRHPVKEWLAFRALPLLSSCSDGDRVVSAGCRGGRKAGAFLWAVWDGRLDQRVIATLLALRLDDLGQKQLSAYGIPQRFRAALIKTADGYGGVFGPTNVF